MINLKINIYNKNKFRIKYYKNIKIIILIKVVIYSIKYVNYKCIILET